MATRPAHGNAASGYPGGSARPEPSRASSSSGAAEHTGGPRSSVNDDEFLEDCSEAFPPPPPPAVPLPGVLPPSPPLRAPVLKPPPHSETGGAPEHAHAPTPWQMLPQPTYLLWPAPLAAAAAISPAAAAAAAAGKPLPEVLRAAFYEVVMPVRVKHGLRLRREPSGLWLPDEWLPVDSETWRMRVDGAAEHTVQPCKRARALGAAGAQT